MAQDICFETRDSIKPCIHTGLFSGKRDRDNGRIYSGTDRRTILTGFFPLRCNTGKFRWNETRSIECSVKWPCFLLLNLSFFEIYLFAIVIISLLLFPQRLVSHVTWLEWPGWHERFIPARAQSTVILPCFQPPITCTEDNSEFVTTCAGTGERILVCNEFVWRIVDRNYDQGTKTNGIVTVVFVHQRFALFSELRPCYETS